MILPVVTTATGAFLVVIVFGMSDGIRAQSASLGHADEIGRAVVLIAVTVLLVGVVEVAVATTRTVAHRTRELGVLGANGVPRTPVVAALLVEPLVAAVLGAVVGAALAVLTGSSSAQRVRRPPASPSAGLLLGVGDRGRRQHRRGAGHQHRAHLERGFAATHPIADSGRLIMTAIEDENRRQRRVAPTTKRGARHRDIQCVEAAQARRRGGQGARRRRPDR